MNEKNLIASYYCPTSGEQFASVLERRPKALGGANFSARDRSEGRHMDVPLSGKTVGRLIDTESKHTEL